CAATPTYYYGDASNTVDYFDYW
nr:immunoglobulin heavy chain junction region [Macaca mulatta]